MLSVDKFVKNTWDTCLYFTVVSQSEERVSTEHGIMFVLCLALLYYCELFSNKLFLSRGSSADTQKENWKRPHTQYSMFKALCLVVHIIDIYAVCDSFGTIWTQTTWPSLLRSDTYLTSPCIQEIYRDFSCGSAINKILCGVEFKRNFSTQKCTRSATDNTELIIDIEINIIEKVRVIGISEHFNLRCLSTHYTMT